MVAQYPDDAPSFVLLGNIYGALQDLSMAKKSSATALRLDPDNKNAKAGLEQVDQLLTRRKRI
jgi:cytochrome c-type biogenesis protein CcmH/NrfG